MIRKMLFASVAASGLLVTLVAHSQLPVIDASAISKLVTEINTLQQQLNTAIQTYNEVISVYNSLNQLVHADSWASVLNVAGMQNPLPFSSAQFPGYIGGQTNPAGLPFGQTFLNQNTVGGSLKPYQDGTFVGGQIVAQIQSISAMQATATNNLLSLETRLAALPQIVQQLANAFTVQQTNSISTRLHGEQNYVSGQQNQANNMLSASQMQLAVLQLNMRQYEYQDEANGIGTMCQAYSASSGNGGITVSLPECQ